MDTLTPWLGPGVPELPADEHISLPPAKGEQQNVGYLLSLNTTQSSIGNSNAHYPMLQSQVEHARI